MEVVQKDTQVIDNSGGKESTSTQNPDPTQAPEGQQPATPVVPATDEAAAAKVPADDAAATENLGADPQKFAEALLQQLGKQQAGQPGQPDQQASQPSFDETMATKREAVTTSLVDTVHKVQEGMTGLKAKMESGEIDLQTYMVQREALNDQKWEAQRGADSEILKIDNEVSRVREREEEHAQSSRMQYAEQNPDFAEMYNSGAIQKVMNDPAVTSVLGNSPAAAHQFLKGQQLQAENTTLQARIAELEKNQQSAISNAAANPAGKLGTTGGGNPSTPQVPNGSKTNSTDSMIAAMQKTRAPA